jgi:uncharacterized membrane protein
MKLTVKLIAFIAIMGALGNVLGLLAINIPSAPGTNVEFHLSVLPALLVSAVFGPLAGAVTGALGTIMSTISIGNLFIPFGNALLAGIAGILGKKFKLPPPASGALAVIPYAPYMWLACVAYGTPESVIVVIIAKAFIEVLMASTLIELILVRTEIRNLLAMFKN